MEGLARACLLSARLTRESESSRLQLELVRRAFELLVPHPQRPIRQHQAVHRQQRSAAAAVDVGAPGE